MLLLASSPNRHCAGQKVPHTPSHSRAGRGTTLPSHICRNAPSIPGTRCTGNPGIREILVTPMIFLHTCLITRFPVHRNKETAYGTLYK